MNVMRRMTIITILAAAVFMMFTVMPLAAGTVHADSDGTGTSDPGTTAVESTVDGLKYSFNDEDQTATVVGYDTENPNPAAVIPAEVNQGGDTPICDVIGIGEGAFANFGELTSVEIPASVKTIGENAFANCDQLQSAVYSGTKEQWRKVSVGAGNGNLTNVLQFQYSRVRSIVLSQTKFTYNGGVQKPVIKTISGKELVEGTDYEIAWTNPSSTNPGMYTLTVTGKGDYVGKDIASYTINKAPNTMKVKGKTVRVSYARVKKKAKTLNVKRVIKFTDMGQGTKTYAKKSGNKKITINKNTGKIKIRKGLKKGTYKVKIKVKDSGNAFYASSDWVTVKIKVRVR